MIKLGVPFTGIKTELDVVNTSEAEAMAMACGVSLAGGEVRVYMQDDGFLNTLNVMTTLIWPYSIDDIMQTIMWRKDLAHHIHAHKLARFIWFRAMNKPLRA